MARAATATTSIWKEPVEGRVRRRRGQPLEGDRQADLRFHGGADKAVYAYAREDYDWWEVELGELRSPRATFGEDPDARRRRLDVTCAARRRAVAASAGRCSRCTGPRTPCWKLGARMESAEFPVYFAAAGRPGAYLRVRRRRAS